MKKNGFQLKSGRYSKILLALILLGFFIFWVVDLGGSRLKPILRMDNPRGFGAYGPIIIEFPEEMDAEGVISRFELIPTIAGEWRWERRKAEFWPLDSLAGLDQVTLSLRSGSETSDGRKINREYRWIIPIRPANVIYLANPLSQPEIWSIDPETQKKTQLTFTQGKVNDFAPKPSGEAIVYSAVNEFGGLDLFLVSSSGGTSKILVQCGKDRCAEAVWSPNGETIAYSRIELSKNQSAQRIWLVQSESGETEPLFRNMDQVGNLPSWSPDGRRLAFYDRNNHAIQVFDWQTGQTIFVPTFWEGMGSWIDGGQGMIFGVVDPAALEQNVNLYHVRFDQEISPEFLAGTHSDLDYSVPMVSPDGAYYLVGWRNPVGPVGKQLYQMRIDGTEMIPVALDVMKNHAHYRWDPSGKRVVFQQIELGNSNSLPEIALWNKTTGEVTVLVQDAALPVWLP